MSLSAKINIGTDKEFYQQNVWKEAPIFFQPFYLDAITNNQWKVVYATVSGKMIAGMPFQYDSAKKQIRKPPFSIYQGPYFNPSVKLNLTEQMLLLEKLEQSMPIFQHYNQNWHPSVKNWLPFFWKGYAQSTRYSYIIAPDTIERVRSRYSENVRRNIKKAAKQVTIKQAGDDQALFKMIEKTFDRKKEKNPIEKEILGRLVETCSNENCIRILFARDEQTNCHAAMLLVFDTTTVYYLAGGIDPVYKNSGAMTLLFDSAIEWALSQNKYFDFEGSMIKSIETFFRSFGASQQEYFIVFKSSLLFKIKEAILKLAKGS